MRGLACSAWQADWFLLHCLILAELRKPPADEPGEPQVMPSPPTTSYVVVLPWLQFNCSGRPLANEASEAGGLPDLPIFC